MILGFATKGWEDYQYWQQNDKKISKRVKKRSKRVKKQKLATVLMKKFYYLCRMSILLSKRYWITGKVLN